MPRRPDYPKPRLTSGGKQRAEFKNDAPPALQGLALTQVPASLKGPAMRGAFVRGWCDSTRGIKATANPYHRAGSGWHHAMATVYADGWRVGKRVLRVDAEAEGMSQGEYDRYTELRERVQAILRGEIVGRRG